MADRLVERDVRDESAAGWAVAAVIIALVLIGGIVLYQRNSPAVPGVPNTGGTPNTNVDVTIPPGASSNAGAVGGPTSSASGSGNSAPGSSALR